MFFQRFTQNLNKITALKFAQIFILVYLKIFVRVSGLNIENERELGLNEAKNTDYMEKRFKLKFCRIK